VKRFFNIRIGVGLSLFVIAVISTSMAGAVLAQTDQAQMSVRVPTEQVKKGNDDITVDIVADNVKNLAAFQFSLTYDSSIVKYVNVEGGSFLGSSGREPQCLKPEIDGGSPETLHFNCVTLGPPPSVQGGKAGVDGSGVLATVTFTPVGGGTSPFELKEGRLIAAELDAKGMPVEISTALTGASLDVAADSGGLSLAIIGAIVGVVAAVIVVLGFVFLRLRRTRTSAW